MAVPESTARAARIFGSLVSAAFAVLPQRFLTPPVRGACHNTVHEIAVFDE
jgi:hypothetical protein